MSTRRAAQIQALQVGNVYCNRRGKQFEVLEKDVEIKGDFHGIPRTKFKLRIYDPEFEREYDVYGMDTDEIEIVDGAKTLRGKAKDAAAR